MTTARTITALLLLALSPGCQPDKNGSAPQPLTPYSVYVPEYLPRLVVPEYNPWTEEGIALGRKLYYDDILSNTGQSCASCHIQEHGFANPVNPALPHINLAWGDKFMWNGSKEGDLEDAMLFEVEEFFGTDISKLNAHDSYPDLFEQVFGQGEITSRTVAYALAQFIRSQISLNSRFDQYTRGETMLTTQEINGFVIFNSEKGDCFHCHSLGLFNDNDFHNIGLDSVFAGTEMGRFLVTGNPADIGRFKTPTLRNIELTAPYMHDGRYSTLEEVIEHYNSRVLHSPTLDPILTKPNHLFGLQLTDQEKADLLAFLKTLTDWEFVGDPGLAGPG